MTKPIANGRRYRPWVRSNTVTLTMERGDGECISLGSTPTNYQPLDIAEFLLRVSKTEKALGTYSYIGEVAVWSTPRLEFHLSDITLNRANEDELVNDEWLNTLGGSWNGDIWSYPVDGRRRIEWGRNSRILFLANDGNFRALVRIKQEPTRADFLTLCKLLDVKLEIKQQ